MINLRITVSEIHRPLSKIMAVLMINFYHSYSSRVGSPLSKDPKTSKYFVEIELLNSKDPLKQELNNFLTNKLLIAIE